MLRELARVVREARLAAGRTQIEIATAAGVSHAVISRLETAVRWPQEPDAVVASYERECGLRPGTLWRRAAREVG